MRISRMFVVSIVPLALLATAAARPQAPQPPAASPQAVEAILQQTANNRPCPEPREANYVTVIPLPGIPVGTPVEAPNQRCQGDAGYNNFYGKGIVDALKAVTAK